MGADPEGCGLRPWYLPLEQIWPVFIDFWLTKLHQAEGNPMDSFITGAVSLELTENGTLIVIKATTTDGLITINMPREVARLVGDLQWIRMPDAVPSGAQLKFVGQLENVSTALVGRETGEDPTRLFICFAVGSGQTFRSFLLDPEASDQLILGLTKVTKKGERTTH
ncbi:hypothetical protein G5V57_27015 [Nordella sp. HKS 07]|uniref:hypothetical protein n=1 Tax=Nordella sp. HKS 07 TaxID=2712222 RepID=UPI0013E1E57C|nr:hypothetical protein [Nordella sp. HKS 07]QIG51055.1 hypothetical protein G5V57_27015 [Nordella sp. HKS 07]